MLSVAVCDDEVIECCHIAGRIEAILKEMKIPCIIRQFYSGRELLGASDHFDIIFLDILMRDLDGMKTARLVRRKTADKILIFISSSREYILEGYEVEAFQYLLKPVDENKLKRVLQRAVRKMEDHPQEFLLISKERHKKKLFLDQVFYFEIKGRTIDVHEKDGVFTYYEQIGILEELLLGKGFFRCHKSYLVNLKHVISYNRQEMILDNEERIAIARRRYDRFCQEILKYLQNSGEV